MWQCVQEGGSLFSTNLSNFLLYTAWSHYSPPYSCTVTMSLTSIHSVVLYPSILLKLILPYFPPVVSTATVLTVTCIWYNGLVWTIGRSAHRSPCCTDYFKPCECRESINTEVLAGRGLRVSVLYTSCV